MSLLLTLGLGSSGAAPTPPTGGNTPYMSLLLPTVSVTLGPLYASEVNQAFLRVDQHDHSDGFGKKVNTAGIQLDADLSFHGFSAKNLDSAQYNIRTPSAGLTGQVYFSGKDMYCVDGAGTVIQITAAGAVNAGTTGNWAGLTPPAEAGYNSVTKTFTLKTNTTGPKFGFLQVGDILLTPADPSTSGVFVQLRASGVSSYTFVFPQTVPAGVGTKQLMLFNHDGTTSLGPTLPSVPKFLRMDSNGNPLADTDIDPTTMAWITGGPAIGGTVGVKAQGITNQQIAPNTVRATELTAQNFYQQTINYSNSGAPVTASGNVLCQSSPLYAATNARPIMLSFQPSAQNPAATSLFRIFSTNPVVTFTIGIDGSSANPGGTTWNWEINQGGATRYSPWFSIVIPPGTLTGGTPGTGGFTHNFALTISVSGTSSITVNGQFVVTEL